MKKSKILLFLLLMILILAKCQSVPDRTIEKRNNVCEAVSRLPDSLDHSQILRTDDEDYVPGWWANEWVDYSKHAADCIRADQCMAQWLQWDGNCGWSAAQRGQTLKGFLGLSEKCSIPKPTCKP